MIRGCKFPAYTIVSVLGLVSTAIGADATCVLPGTWHFFALEAASPGITTTTENVGVNAPPKSISIETFAFSKTSTGYTNSIATAISCTMAVQANGSFSAPCTSYGVSGSSKQSVTVSGQLSASASCGLSGTINIPGDKSVSIVSGHINGESGAGIGTQGSKVMSFTLVKE